jgi:hypothetical protein
MNGPGLDLTRESNNKKKALKIAVGAKHVRLGE